MNNYLVEGRTVIGQSVREARKVQNVGQLEGHKKALQVLTLLRCVLFTICLIGDDKTKGSDSSAILLSVAIFGHNLNCAPRTFSSHVDLRRVTCVLQTSSVFEQEVNQSTDTPRHASQLLKY